MMYTEILRPLQRSLLMFALCVAVASCGKKITNGDTFGSTDSSSTGGGGTVTNDYFKVTVTNTATPPVITHMHKFGSLTEPCQIAKYESDGTTINKTSTDLKCMVDIREQDLFFNGLKLTLNVPPGLCYYLEEIPYAYYNHVAGYGPGSSQLVLTQASSTDPYIIASCSAYSQVDSITSAQASLPTTISADKSRCYINDGSGYYTSDGQFHCAYDHTDDGAFGYNCCAGTYNNQVVSFPFGGTSSITTSSGKYPGYIGNCTDGPFREAAPSGLSASTKWPVTTQGYPTNLWYNVSTSGFNEYFEIPGILNVRDYSYFYRSANWHYTEPATFIANMYNWSLYNRTSVDQTAWDAASLDASKRPYAISRGFDLSGNVIKGMNDAYEYRCVDRAGEVKQRIRVYVNKWNTDDEFENYMTGVNEAVSAPSAASAAVVNSDPRAGSLDGTDGTSCPTESNAVSGNLSYCDDYWNWDDIEDNFTTNFPTNASSTWVYRFPRSPVKLKN